MANPVDPNPDQQVEPLLFHYTSVGTAAAVLKSTVLWSTHIYYLNDGSEFTHGVTLMRQFLEPLARTDRLAAEFLEKMSWTAFQFPEVDIFVTSFSEAEDLLSQWRSYCQPNRGVNLGFDASRLERAATEQGFELVKCSYDEKLQREAIKELGFNGMSQYASATTEDERREVAASFSAAFARLAASFKNESFQEEREWRLIRIAETKEKIEYREGASTLIPFIMFHLPRDEKGRVEIPKIILGPTIHPPLSRRAMADAVRDAEIRWGSVVHSKTPYRAW